METVSSQFPSTRPCGMRPSSRLDRGAALLLSVACLVTLSASQGAVAATQQTYQDEPADQLGRERLLLLREAFQLVNRVGNELWPGWANVPLTVLVVAEDHEFLVNTPGDWEPSAGFEPADQEFLGRPIYRRRRTLPMALRAAFPVDGVPAAVVGAWRQGEESPNEWATTLVHEWFHVLQMHRDEESKVEALDLAGATYPSLQLDYPFAYGDHDIANALHLLGNALYDFWERSRNLPRAMQRTFVAQTSWAALRNFETLVRLKYGDDAYSYFRYQTWKEGVARYTEVHVTLRAAELDAAGRLRPVAGFETIAGAVPYRRLFEEVTRTNFWEIRPSVVDGADPTAFYGIGHGLAELLDEIHPEWKARYFEEETWLDDLVTEKMAPDRSTDS